MILSLLTMAGANRWTVVGEVGAVEDAVDAVADDELALVGLDVDVGRADGECFAEDVVDEPDDAGFLGLFEFVVAGGFCDDVFEVVRHGVERVARDAVMRADERAEVFVVGEDEFR